VQEIFEEILNAFSGPNPLNPLNQPTLVLLNQLMFPNTHHSPPHAEQRPRYEGIPRGVAGNFSLPVTSIAFRHPTVLWTTMPEAAINKDCDFMV
jgi:hypothetical protein